MKRDNHQGSAHFTTLGVHGPVAVKGVKAS